MKAGREGGGRRGAQTQNRVTEGERGREERGLEQGKGKRRSREKLRNEKREEQQRQHASLCLPLSRKTLHSSHVVLVLEEEFISEKGEGRRRTRESRKEQKVKER